MHGSLDLKSTVNSIVAKWSISGLDVLPPNADTLNVKVALQYEPKEEDDAEGDRDRGSIHVTALRIGAVEARGFSEFHFLLARTMFTVTLKVDGIDEPLAVERAKTGMCGQAVPQQLANRISKEMWQTYVGPEHSLGQWLGDSREDMVWCWQPDFSMTRSLWLNACFTLPNESSPITSCPNPATRYCLDLSSPSHWLRSKKVRRFKRDFTITVNKDFLGTFSKCEELHRQRDRGCWITEELMAALDKCRKQDGDLKVYSIELWEKSSGKLAAAIMSLSVGDIFHDYTTAAFIRDHRSPGSILTKVLGHFLCECGFSLWYWGFKNPYMAEYDSHYGGVSMNNKTEFWPRWKAARERAEACDLASRLGPEPLDLATLISR